VNELSNGAARGLHIVSRLLDATTWLFALIGGIAVFLLAMVTIVAVAWRYLLNDPIFGVEDISVALLIVVAAASVAVGARTGSHVSVDIASKLIGSRTRAVLEVVTRILTVGIIGLASYALVEKACGPERACITGNLNIVHRPFYYLLAAAMAVYAASEVLKIFTGDKSDPKTESLEILD
jgi:TRAP-type C4-dicarboxylate transport system permease small subunit